MKFVILHIYSLGWRLFILFIIYQFVSCTYDKKYLIKGIKVRSDLNCLKIENKNYKSIINKNIKKQLIIHNSSVLVLLIPLVEGHEFELRCDTFLWNCERELFAIKTDEQFYEGT